MHRQKGLKRIGLALAVILNFAAEIMVLTFLFFVFIYPVKAVKPVYNYELGEELVTSPDYYVTGNKYALELCELDFSKVDAGKTGNYTVQIKRAFQLIDIQIQITDTTPPEMTLRDEEMYLQVGNSYSSNEFVSEVFDVSGSVDLEISFTNDGFGSEIVPEAIGNYTVFVKATDASGNYAICSQKVIADTPPQISISKDIYAAVGCDIDFKKNISVFDEHDGDITEKVRIDTTGFSGDMAGDFYVTYTATDMYGFTTTAMQPVHMYSGEDLQWLINTGQIHRSAQMIVGAYNLYDGGILFTDDTGKVMDHFQPSFVRLEYPDSFGSGFIIEITDTDIIICTNYHVVKPDQNLTVYFYNGFCCEGELAGRVEGMDVAFVKVALDKKTSLLLEDLKTVHIDNGYVEELKIQNPEALAVCFRTINKEGGVWRDRTGYLLAAETPIGADVLEKYPNYFANVETVCAFSAKSYSGSSGSAVLDSRGNLIGMISYHNDIPNELGHQYFGMTLSDILDTYEFFFQKKIHYK